jgi:hypothetical protein
LAKVESKQSMIVDEGLREIKSEIGREVGDLTLSVWLVVRDALGGQMEVYMGNLKHSQMITLQSCGDCGQG